MIQFTDEELLRQRAADADGLAVDLREAEAWNTAAVEYIELLQDACARFTLFAHFHGYLESPEVIQRGKELRAILGIKGAGDA